jgi:hypothetical protein
MQLTAIEPQYVPPHQELQWTESLVASLLQGLGIRPVIIRNPVTRNHHARPIVATPAMHKNRRLRRVLQQGKNLRHLLFLRLKQS